jgi:hypothetical protein
VVGGLAGVALFAAAVAVCVPLVLKRLRAHAPAADETARRVEAAVTRGLGSVGALADAYRGGLPWPGGPDTPAAALPDAPPPRVPVHYLDPGDGPASPPFLPPPWEAPPVFWKPFYPRPAPWHFHRRPLWRAGGWRRR